MSTASTEANKELVRQYFQALNDGDRAELAALQSDNVVYHTRDSELRGIDAVMAHAEAQLEAIPDLTETIDMLFAEDDTVAVRTRATGTHERELFGIEPTGEAIDVVSMQVARVDDGEIVEWWNHPDRLGLLQQLGVIEAPLE